MDHTPLTHTEDDWEKALTPEQYAVLRQKGTEAPFTGKLLTEKRDGMYYCAACGNQLFDSSAKYDSGTGWPSFTDSLPGAVEFHEDISHGMQRVEVTCAGCHSHLGHVFDDGPDSGKRYCLNSVCLDFNEKEKPQK